MLCNANSTVLSFLKSREQRAHSVVVMATLLCFMLLYSDASPVKIEKKVDIFNRNEQVEQSVSLETSEEGKRHSANDLGGNRTDMIQNGSLAELNSPSPNVPITSIEKERTAVKYDEIGSESDAANALDEAQKRPNGGSGSFRPAGGAVYVRWGRTVCRSGAELVYTGVVAGAWFGNEGGGSNTQCLHNFPEWGRYKDGLQSRSYMFGAEYEIQSNNPFDKPASALHDHDIPCAVCFVYQRVQLMVPGRVTCPAGWRSEYTGYLMGALDSNKGPSSYICVDRDLETERGGAENKNGAVFYVVEARCGSLPCPPYVEGREITCVVCSKD